MNPTRKSFLLSLVLLCCPHLCKSQDVQIDKVADEHGGYFMKWDTVQERLIAYRSGSVCGPSLWRGREQPSGLSVERHCWIGCL